MRTGSRSGLWKRRFLCVALLLAPAARLGAEGQPPVKPIGFGQSVEGALAAPGASAWYEIHLDKGDFFVGFVDQIGVDVLVVIHSPGGLSSLESDSRWHGREPIWILAEVSGTYRIELRALEKRRRDGRYVLTTGLSLAPGSHDEVRRKAQALGTEAKRQLQKNMVDGPQQALAKYTEALPLWESTGDRAGLSQTLNTLGHIYHRLLKFPQAVDSYNRSSEIRRQDGDRIGESECLHNLAALHSTRGESDKARELYFRALELRRAAGDELGQVQTLSNLGTVYFRSGNFPEALRYFEEALPLLRDLNAKPEMIQTMIGLGAIYHRFGEWQSAVDCLEQNRALLKEINYLPGLAFNQLNLGAMYTEMGDLERAIVTLQDVPELMRRAGSKSGEAAALLNLGNAYVYKNENTRALECYEQSRSILGDANDPAVLCAALVYTGRALIQAGRYVEARDGLARALERVQKLGDRRWEAQTRLYLGLLDETQGADDAAAEQMRQALASSQGAAFTSGEVNALLSLGELDRKRGRWEQAATSFEEGIRIIETMRSGVRTQQLRLTFFAMMQSFYDGYIDVLMQLHARQPDDGYDAAALQVSERARARLLVERLTGGGARLEVSGGPELADEERRLRQRLSLLVGDPPASISARGAEQQTAGRESLNAVAQQYQELHRRIQEQNPAYAALTQPEPVTLVGLQEILDPGTALLEYKLGPDRSFLWVVTREKLSSYVLPSVSVIEARAHRLYGLLTERNRRLDGETFAQKEKRILAADRQTAAAAAEMTCLLLEPAAPVLTAKRLVMVPEGVLQWIPFEALPLPPTEPPAGGRAGGPGLLLVDRYEIVYLPSASALQARRQHPRLPQAPGQSVAIFADPVFDPADPRVTRSLPASHPPASSQVERRLPSDLSQQIFPPGTALPRLPFSRIEAQTISRLAPAGRVRKALDFQASRAAALNPGLGRYRYIHFATHGLISTERPEWSGLVLSLVDKHGRERDGFLRLNDIYNLRVSAQLVTLSACQTALGKDFRGEGLMSLTRGFMYAGAERVLASVWKVDDEATARLMEEFYRRLLGPQSQPPAQALREAKQTLRRQKRWRAPHFWAGFVLLGEWRGQP